VSAEAPFEFEEVRVSASGLQCGALVMAPRSRMLIDAARRDRLRGDPALSEADRTIVGRVRSRGDDVPILIMRGANDLGERLWEFDAAFSDDELEEVGRLLTRALLPLHRRFLCSGIILFVHTEWGVRETPPMRRAVASLAHELQASAPANTALRDLDLWILRNMLLFSSLSAKHVVQSLLPAHLRLVSHRKRQIADLVARAGSSLGD
jgi:hypothetical protein